MHHQKILVVGAGISGSTIARRFAEAGARVDIIEKRDHIAGNCYDYIDNNGVRISKYGPHYFHTTSERVWDWVQRFGQWTFWENRVLSFLGKDRFVPMPVNRTTVNSLFDLQLSNDQEMEAWLAEETAPYQMNGRGPSNSEEVALSRVGPRLYELLVKHYTLKQWGVSAAELDPLVLMRIPVRLNTDDRYFGCPYQALPTDGYTTFVEHMLKYPTITVQTDVDYLQGAHSLRQRYNLIFYSGPVDAYFAEAATHLEALQFRSLNFEHKILDLDNDRTTAWPLAQINFPRPEDPWTRLTEYKHIMHQKSRDPYRTTVVFETSSGDGDPYYPFPDDRNRNLYLEYKALADKATARDHVYFVGRLACYKYYNMDQAMLAALELADKFLPAETAGA